MFRLEDVGEEGEGAGAALEERARLVRVRLELLDARREEDGEAPRALEPRGVARVREERQERGARAGDAVAEARALGREEAPVVRREAAVRRARRRVDGQVRADEARRAVAPLDEGVAALRLGGGRHVAGRAAVGRRDGRERRGHEVPRAAAAGRQVDVRGRPVELRVAELREDAADAGDAVGGAEVALALPSPGEGEAAAGLFRLLAAAAQNLRRDGDGLLGAEARVEAQRLGPGPQEEDGLEVAYREECSPEARSQKTRTPASRPPSRATARRPPRAGGAPRARARARRGSSRTRHCRGPTPRASPRARRRRPRRPRGT